MIKRLLPYVLKLIEKNNIAFNFFDAGARNGALLLKDIAPYVNTYGFEPNPEEYRKLVNGNTDLFLFAGKKSPPYKRIEYFEYALTNSKGKAIFYVTPGPGAAGLKEPELKELKKIKWKGKSYRKNFAEDVFSGYRKIEVNTCRLDDFTKEKAIKYIDFLKIDVEGAEYDVIDGAKAVLKNIGVIKVETCFIPFRKNQKLFSHVDLLLRDNGFDLINYQIEQAQIGYKERKRPIKYTPVGYYDQLGQPLSADAFYVNRNITDEKRLMAQAVVLMDFNYIDEALYILKNKVNLKDEQYVKLLIDFKYWGDGIGERIQTLGYRLIDGFVSVMGGIKRNLINRKYKRIKNTQS